MVQVHERHERHEKSLMTLNVLLYKDECYRIQGAVFEVYREMGCGFLEAVYQEYLERELKFYLTNNIKKYDSDFIHIRKELESYPEIAFAVEEVADGVLVTFCQRESVSGGVSGGVSELFAYIKGNPGKNTPELMSALNIPKRTIERWLKQLKDRRAIAYRGAAKSGGYYAADEMDERSGSQDPT